MDLRADGPTVSTPLTLGPFRLVAPEGRGEMIRITVPIGEVVTRAARAWSASHRRRQADAARRAVVAELEAFRTRERGSK